MAIKVITEHVDMPTLNERRYQLFSINGSMNNWEIIDSDNNRRVYKGKYDDSLFRCYYMNKAYYNNINYKLK